MGTTQKLQDNLRANSRLITQHKADSRFHSYVLFEKADNFRDSFQTVLNEGDVDAILIHATDQLSSRVDLIAEARNRGIGVYCWDADLVEGSLVNVTVKNGVVGSELFYMAYNDMYDGKKPFSAASAGWFSMPYMNERTYTWDTIAEVLPQASFYADEDVSAMGLQYGSAYAAYQTTQAWNAKTPLKDNIDCILACCDDVVYGLVEGIKATGDTTGEFTRCATTEGGDTALTYLRNNTPLKYVYCQPYELEAYSVCEIIKQIQIDGLNPGDADCLLTAPGQSYFVDGVVATMDTVPAVGNEYHAIFNYYGGDPEDPKAWWNWDTEEYPNGCLAESQYEANF